MRSAKLTEGLAGRGKSPGCCSGSKEAQMEWFEAEGWAGWSTQQKGHSGQRILTRKSEGKAGSAWSSPCGKKKEGVGSREFFMGKNSPFWGEISSTQRLKRHHVAEEVTAYRFWRRGCRRKRGGTAEIALGESWNEAGSERYFCKWAHPKIFCFSSWNQRARSSWNCKGGTSPWDYSNGPRTWSCGSP